MIGAVVPRFRAITREGIHRWIPALLASTNPSRKPNSKCSIIENACHFHCSRIYQFPEVELTSKRYSGLQRGPYAQLTEDDVKHFQSIVGENGIIRDPDELKAYNTDWMKSCQGYSSIVLRPKTTEAVSQILSYCNSRKLAVCPQGGNTGLVGGSVPVFDEVILSTSLMNQIISFDELSGVLVCQAGCVLENLERHAEDNGFIMPFDLGAKGSCQIGGNVSTNAGGLRLLRYGSLHGSVLGLEVVLANGQILDCMSAMRKDNTGYDLKQLFIGSEGTLGVVTKVALLCPPKPEAVSVAFLGCRSFEDILKIFIFARKKLSEILSSFEMMDHFAMDAVENHLKLTAPIGNHPFYVLVEVAGSDACHNEEKLTRFLEELINQSIIEDGTASSELHRVKSLWAFRERITESLMYDGYVYKYDISLPRKDYYEVVTVMKERLGDQVTRCCGYGHLGDGNMHLNITAPKFDPKILAQIEPFLFQWIADRKGSISAEHGLGFKKNNFIGYSKSQSAIDLMKQLKSSMDPHGILNPYKVLPV